MVDFIMEDKIDPSICQQMIYLFESHPDDHFQGEVTGYNTKNITDHNQKKSVDFECRSSLNLPIMQAYYDGLHRLLIGYMQTYPEVNELERFSASHCRIQKYDKDGHFRKWHFERNGGYTRQRCLVYMTYLNDVEDGGQTDFKYQRRSFQPKAGKTLIWPSDWTHTHRGWGPKEGYKYISTGWYVHNQI